MLTNKNHQFFAKKTILILLFFSIPIHTILSQDRIIKIYGDTIYCAIKKIDSTKITYTKKVNEEFVTNTINREDVLNYNYHYKYTASPKFKVDTIASLGLVIVQNKKQKLIKVYINNKDATFVQLSKLMKSDKEAYSLLKKAKHRSTLVRIFAQSGGFLIGFSLANAVLGESDPETTITLTSTGAVFIGIGFALKPKVNYFILSAIKKYDVNYTNKNSPQ